MSSVETPEAALRERIISALNKALPNTVSMVELSDAATRILDFLHTDRFAAPPQEPAAPPAQSTVAPTPSRTLEFAKRLNTFRNALHRAVVVDCSGYSSEARLWRAWSEAETAEAELRSFVTLALESPHVP